MKSIKALVGMFVLGYILISQPAFASRTIVVSNTDAFNIDAFDIDVVIMMCIVFYVLLMVVLIAGKVNRNKKEKILQAKHREQILSLTNEGEGLTPEEFLEARKDAEEYTGIYILFNETKDMYYVGQGQKVLSRINQHFTGHGNGDVYADWKYGDVFKIKTVKLNGSGFDSLDALERNAIATYNSYYKGYNKTRGNRG